MLAMGVLVHAFYPEPRAASEFADRYGRAYLRIMSRGGPSRDAWRNAMGMGVAQHAAGVRRYLGALWDQLAGDACDLAYLERYRQASIELRDDLAQLQRSGEVSADGVGGSGWSEAVRWVLPSLVHMSNNRLGVSIPEEAYLAQIMSLSLS